MPGWIVNLVCSLCLIYMVALVASYAIKCARLNRVDRLKMLKGYAKGRFILIYICAIPLFLIACLHDGNHFIEAVFSAVQGSVELVVLKFEFERIATLVADNLYFAFVVVILFGLCILNLGMVSVALFCQKFINSVYTKRATKNGAKTYVVVGVNEKNRNVLTSANGARVWVINAKERTEELDEFAYINSVAVVTIKDGRLDATLKSLFKDFTDKTIKVIINTGSDETNLLYTEELTTLIRNANISRSDIEDERGLNVYSFGAPENSSAFLHFVKLSSGQVRYINKYKLIAIDFVDKHPLTEFMGENEINYDTATLKEDVDLNVVMVGYNKTMQEILVTSIANNQFSYLDKNGNVLERKVNYNIFRSNGGATTEKNLNYTYNRYVTEREEMLKEKDKYLELPEVPAEVNFILEDVNDITFYKSIKKAIMPKEGRRAFNQVIVSYGEDIENIDIAEKLSAKIKEWGFDEYTNVYVKVRSNELTERIVKDEYKEICKLTTFASEKEVVYNTKNIVSEDIETMARDRHLAYAVCSAIKKGKSEKEAKEGAIEQWYKKWEQPQREANVYGVLSIRMKLNLMGFDYAKGEPNPEVNKEYMNRYQEGDTIIYEKGGKVGGKETVHYDNNFVEGSLRQRLAIQEHQRWNAYMITQGVIPSTKVQIEEEEGKNMKLRRHGCLTTFDGLIEYRQIMAKARNSNEEQEDVIRWDYQLMDDVIWLLERNGNALIKK